MKLTARLVHGAVLCAALIGLTSFGATTMGAKWGNIGDATSGGVATGINKINSTSAWTLNFAANDNMAVSGIGGSGVVKIKQVTFVARDSELKDPSSLTLLQDDVLAVSDSFSKTGTITVYSSTKTELGTRTSYVFTFDDDVLFDTSREIVLSFGGTTVGLSVVKPANSVFKYDGTWSPAIEIVGDYTPNGEMTIELQHHYSFNGTTEATSGQPLTFQGGGTAYEASGNGQALKIGASSIPYGTGILQSGEECWTISTFAKLCATEKAVVWAIGRHSDNTGYVALTTGTNGQVQVVKSASQTVMTAQTLLTSSIVAEDFANRYHLYTITRNNNFLRLYVDGALAGTYYGEVTLPDGRFQLGKVRGSLDNTGLVQGNDVCIDEWRLYQGELTAAGVQALAALFPVWPQDNIPETVSINFVGGSTTAAYASGGTITDQETAGAIEVAGLNWNQVCADSTGGKIEKTDISLKEVLKDGSTVTGVMTMDVTASRCWNAQDFSTPVSGNGRMMYGYLDDGETSSGYGAQVTVKNIPYSEYSVYIYVGADQEVSSSLYYTYSTQFLSVYVNDVQYPSGTYYWGYWGYASSTHEKSTALVLAEQNNYLKVTGLKSTELRIAGLPKGNWDRGCIAAIQIVNTGTRATTGGDYVADVTKTTTWNGGNGAGLTKHGGDWENDATAAITMTNLASNATLTFDTEVTAAKVDLTQAAGKTLAFKATATATIGAYDVTKSAGTVTFDKSVLGNSIALSGNNAKIIPGGTVDFDLGAGNAMSVSGNGAANGANIQYTLSSGTLSITSGGGNGPFNKSPFTASGANAILKLAVGDATGYNLMNNPAYTFEDGAELQIGVRDTLTTPITLRDSTVRLMVGCASGGRGLDLFNSNGNVWTIEGASALTYEDGIGDGGKRVQLRQGNWTVDVAADGAFTVDPIIYGATMLNKKGAGDLYLNAENEWTGGIVIQAGKVYAGNPKALGTGKVWIQNGAMLVFDLADFSGITGDVTPFNFADEASMARVTAIPDEEHPEITYDPATGTVKLDPSVFGITGLHISSIDPKPKGFDANGHESSVVKLTNYGPDPVNLKNYKLVRTNLGKAVTASGKKAVTALLDREMQVGESYNVYLSEDYPTAKDLKGDGVTVAWFGELMVVPTKVNPKKYPMVQLYDKDGKVVYDEVIVPCEIDDGVTVQGGLNTNKVVRYVVNGNVRTEIGPEINGIYGVKDVEPDIEHLKVGHFLSTAEDFTITLPVNPLKIGGTVLEPNKIAGVILEYRFFDKTSMTSTFVEMTKVAEADPIYGDQWTVTLDKSIFEGQEGKLFQYRATIADQGGSVWTAPRFCHPELGYEWYGAVVEPSEATRTENLPTMLMFADSVNLVQMDKDVDNQDKSQVPYNARIAIYDTSTHSYYDNVRIDLRGNTSANFYKKSHGLRFSKVAPFTTTNPLDGKKWEVRKSSFCTEYADPTYIRQSLSFWLLNQVGSPAPFHYPVRLYLNGEFYQLAFHTERFTDELIEDVYGLNKFVYSYKNIGTFGGNTTAGGIEKKTPDDDNESDLSMLNAYMNRYKTAASKVVTSMTEAEKAALTKNAVTNFDLSAWFNYIAISKITHENDDVWANLSGYINKYDALHNPDGNDLMAPLAYDMNLSWGQWYYGDDSSAGRCGIRPADDNFKSHPFYGGMTIRAHKTGGNTIGNGNRAYEAVFQNEKFRRLYLRRLRTLMDAWLKEPGTPKEETPLWTQYVEPFKALIEGNDVTDDRTKWDYAHIANRASAIWVWNTALSLEDGYDDLWENYIVPRREHLYGKHSVTNTEKGIGYAADLAAGIPEAQSDIAALRAKIGYELVDGGVKITNGNGEEIDISGWTIAGPVTVTIPNGTVLDSVQGGIPGEVYFVTNRIAWCEQHAAELTDQFIIGNVAAGTEGDDLILKTADGTIVIGEKSEQEKYLRLWGFCGVPLTGGEDGPGEFIVLTNLNPTAALDLEGAYLNICKAADDWSTAKCQITFPAGSKIEAGGYLRIEKKDGLETWTAIQNGDLKIKFLAANGASIYTMEEALSQKNKGVKDQDKFLKAIAYNQVPDDWEAHDNSEAPVKPEPPVPPGPEGDVITGEFPEGTNIVLTAAKTLIVSNANFGAALTLEGAHATTLYLPSDTTSRIPVLSAAGAITVDGMGTLSMSNNVTMITAGDLIVTNGTLNLDFQDGAFEKSAVYLTGNFKQLGGAIALNVASTNAVYGIQIDAKNMEAYFEGGTFTPVLAGGEKSSVIKLEKGSSHANLRGGETVVTMSGPTNRFVNTDGKVKIGGTYKATVTSTGLDARVFKATKELTIYGGTITGSATGAGSEMFSTDTYLEMTNGVVGITVAEDGISAKGDVRIKGGKLQILSTGGDAIDSNANIAISGGYVLANATAAGCYGIEVEEGQQLVISGGTVVAVGAEKVIHMPDAGSVGCYTSSSVKYDKDNKYIEVGGTNAVNKLICTVNLKDKCAKKFSLIATCPGFLGTVSYTGVKPDKDLPYIEKLDENLDGAFLTLLDRVEPGKAAEMEAKTEDEAQEEIKKYEVVLTEEDVQAGVEPNMLKMVPQPVTNEVGAVTYYAVVAVNPEVVPAPTVGEDETGEVKPIVVTPTAGGTEVSVGIVNATKGLWYGYEVCDALSEGFANDVPSFKRADGEAITIKGSTRTGASSFFRVKVLPAQPH